VINTFKSTIYHLHHAHETSRDNSTYSIFKKHQSYNDEDWYDHIRRNHDWGIPQDNIDLSLYKDYINESLLHVYTHSQKIRITVCMVTYMRYDILLRSLEKYLSLNVPINMILWINQVKSMPMNIKQRVDELCSRFSGHSIMCSDRNMGTGYPRFMMLNKAYHEFKTDYVMTTDDDIIFNSDNELVLGATVLDQDKYKDYGGIGLWVNPEHPIVTKNDNKINLVAPSEGFHDVDLLGAATMTIRRDVLEYCNCDPRYIIGLVDWDFSMSILSKGWKLGLVCDDRFKPDNDPGQYKHNTEYKKCRMNKDIIDNSKKLFNDKWGIQIK